jgi:carboxypeptidase Q
MKPYASRIAPLLLSAAMALATPVLAQQSAPTPPAMAISAEIEATAAALRDRALQGNIAFKFIEGVTTEVGPRLGGTPAEKKAAEWSVAQLKALGFQDVRIEEFQIDGWVRGAESASVTAPFPQAITITSLGGSVATPKGGLEAEVALFKTYDDFLRAPADCCKGKIVLVTQRTVKAQDGAGYSATVRNRSSGPAEAAKRGAVAYMLRSLGTHSHRFPHTGAIRYEAGVPRVPSAAVSPPDVEQIERMAARGQPVRIKFDIQPRLAGPSTSYTVVGDIKGTDKADEYVIISAHLDSWDLATGALDDAAGMGITAAAGKLILDLPQKPRRTIRIIFFGTEETALQGAYAYAKAHPDLLPKVFAGSESDFGAGPVYQFLTRFNPAVLPAFAPLRRVLAHVNVGPGPNTALGGPDMTPFREAGVPVFTLQQDGRDYFDYHHTPDDTLDKIDPKNLDQNVAAWAATTWVLANMDGELRPIPDPAAPRRLQ